jgi:N-acetylneuraminate lyase
MSYLQGILPAVVTPFDDRGNFLPAPFERLLERLYGAGVNGVYVGGQTGEGLLQAPSQRKLAAEAAVRCSPAGKSVVVHVGAPRLEEAIDLARHAARIGAKAVSSLPPMGGHSFAEIRRFYTSLIGACELPFLIYYFPEICPAIASAAQLLDLCTIPNVAGVKFTDSDLYKLDTVAGTGLAVFNGRDECLAPGLLMGAGGGIGTFYNLAPEWFVDVFRQTRAGDWDRARCVQRKINALIRLTQQFPLFPSVKAMLAWSGIDCGACLPPRGPLTPDEEQRLRAGLAGLELPPGFPVVS